MNVQPVKSFKLKVEEAKPEITTISLYLHLHLTVNKHRKEAELS